MHEVRPFRGEDRPEVIRINPSIISASLAESVSSQRAIRMVDAESSATRLIREMRRRHVFRTAALYIVGAWLAMQVADVVFPALEIPERAMRYVLVAALLGFPVALVLGWFYEIGAHGIRRTRPAGPGEQDAALALRRPDYLILAALASVAGMIVYGAVSNVIETPGQVYEERSDGPPMVAVLPFVSKSLEEEGDFFAVGVHDDLLTQLAQLSSIRVISRTSVLEYKDVERNIREIGAELGADAILEGGVQMAGDRIRINAQLIDARTDEHLWAHTYDRVLSAAGIFDVQAEIARAISIAMNAALSDEEEAQLADIPTENMAAYRAYRKAMQIWNNRGSYWQDDLTEALEEAVSLDPTFTRAWAELAGHLVFQNFFDNDRPDLVRRAEEILEKIRVMAPESADYLFAQAYYAYYGIKDYDLAHQLISQVHQMRPSDTRVLMVKTWIERRQGDFDSRIETVRLARTLDPRDPMWEQSLVHNLMMTHRYDEASDELESSTIEDPALEYYRAVLQLREHRDTGRFVADLERLQMTLDDTDEPWSLWEAHMANRDYVAAEKLLNALEEHDPETPQLNPHVSNRNMAEAFTYWASGKKDLLDEAVLRGKTHLDRSRSPDGSFEHKDLVMDVALLAAVEGESDGAERLMHQGMRAMEEDKASMSGYRQIGCRIFGVAKATEAAVKCIRGALIEPSNALPFQEPFLPYYDSIRGEPEFIELLTGLDLARQEP